MTDRIKEIKNKSERYLNCKSSSPKDLSDFFAIKDIFYLLSEVERLQKENKKMQKVVDLCWIFDKTKGGISGGFDSFKAWADVYEALQDIKDTPVETEDSK